MVKSVASRTAVAAAAIAFVAAAVAGASADVATSAKQYGSSGYGRRCSQKQYKCGLDYDRCTYSKQCVKYGCNRRVGYSCPYKVTETYDCNKEVEESYTKVRWGPRSLVGCMLLSASGLWGGGL